MANTVTLRMTGIILAGGESRRMGTNKAFLEIAGKPLIEHIARLFLEQFEQTIIVTREPERFSGYNAVVMRDALETSGPLTGIYTGLLNSTAEHNFVVACDMPFLNPRLIEYMQQQTGQFDAVVPLVGGLPEPLHAIYHRRTIPIIKEMLVRGERKVASLLEMTKVRYLTGEEIVHFDPLMRSFRNINTPEEYKEAVCSDLGCRS